MGPDGRAYRPSGPAKAYQIISYFKNSAVVSYLFKLFN
jgi:hypothetical protein